MDGLLFLYSTGNFNLTQCGEVQMGPAESLMRTLVSLEVQTEFKSNLFFFPWL